ncbi:MAG TPA: hypothetical protein VNM89_04745 [Solirubrobacterales bacterium]|nr:hypothetical protein [Solirubrobacterales bacterium]
MLALGGALLVQLRLRLRSPRPFLRESGFAPSLLGLIAVVADVIVLSLDLCFLDLPSRLSASGDGHEDCNQDQSCDNDGDDRDS